MKDLSLPLNDFANIIEGNRIYVDKTKYLLPIIQKQGFYFLSRPRRFGKSLLLSTFKYIFQGRKDLFAGLYIEDKIEWKTYPIIYLDFLNISYKDTTLVEGLKSCLRKEAKKENIVEENFLLNYPNKEVRDSFNYFRVAEYIEGDTSLDKLKYNLKKSLFAGNMDLFVENLTILFAQIPYQIATPKLEAYYQLIIYLTLKTLGLEIIAEENTNKGRIDAVIFVPNYIYVIEFKFSSSAKQALLQIKDKTYYEKYLADSRQVCLVGMNFDYENRTVIECVVQKV